MSDNVDRIWLVSNHRLSGFRCGMWTNDPNEISEADVMYVRAALVTEWQTAYQSLSEIRHKLLQERDDWKNRALLASENVDELRAENAKLCEENTYLAADGKHWREMFHEKQREFLRLQRKLDE